MSDTFTMRVENRPGYLLLHLVGLLDGRSAPRLRERCAADTLGNRTLILDLSGVTMITSSGIGALLSLVEEHGQQFRKVRVAAPSEAVASVIRVLNLDQFLTVDATADVSIRAAEAA